jgi:hypothetical protein
MQLIAQIAGQDFWVPLQEMTLDGKPLRGVEIVVVPLDEKIPFAKGDGNVPQRTKAIRAVQKYQPHVVTIPEEIPDLLLVLGRTLVDHNELPVQICLVEIAAATSDEVFVPARGRHHQTTYFRQTSVQVDHAVLE